MRPWLAFAEERGAIGIAQGKAYIPTSDYPSLVNTKITNDSSMEHR
jgi:hypothetical protein